MNTKSITIQARHVKLNVADGKSDSSEFYKWNFEIVARWSAYLDPAQDEIVDISPNTIGNLSRSYVSTDYAGIQGFLFLGRNGSGGRIRYQPCY